MRKVWGEIQSVVTETKGKVAQSARTTFVLRVTSFVKFFSHKFWKGKVEEPREEGKKAERVIEAPNVY